MIIELPKVSPQGSRYEGEESPEILLLEPDSGIEASALSYQLDAQLVSQELVVRGDLSLSVRLVCSRCAVFFSTTVRNSSFLRVYPLREGQLAVDVTGDFREEVLLSLPHHPRCREECAGLCPQCGANLNEGSCSCSPRADAGPWEALNGMFDRPGS